MQRRQTAPRGLSLIELMVAVAIGLVVAAAAVTLLTSQLRESRSLLLEARLMQDLRTTADIVARDLRRAGYWGASTDGVWATGAGAVAANPYAAVAPATAASDAVSFRFSRDAAENNRVDANEQFGFRLRTGVIEIQLGAGNWQALTDKGTFMVTQFSLAPNVQTLSLDAFCARPCPAGASTCPPQQQVRSFTVEIGGRLADDASVTRSVRSQVRLRNDPVVGACAA